MDGGNHGERESCEGMDPLSTPVTNQNKCFWDRDRLVSQVKSLPGFDNFLTVPKFDTLSASPSRGPVIVINHRELRSDILILPHDSPPSLIPTSDDFYGRANGLRDQRDQLLNAKRKGLDSDEYNGALSSVLKVLYKLVGRPVIRRLNELNVPEQSRVWWCPTSVFCSLPLHAMGPIPSNDDVPEMYFSDLYIPSYTPSLSTLTESQRPSARAWDKPSILLIALPDESMPGAPEEMRVIKAVSPTVQTLTSPRATPTTVLERLRDHRFAHFACHGVLEPGGSFQASLKLYDGRRLTLLDIAQSQLPDAEFAFLSASHTAELTDESIPDEALHLASAMQHCGFRSIVGTMWTMVDADGRNVVETFYKSVFSDSDNAEQDVVPLAYYERTAKALRDAVKRLRRKRGITLERWVNFVH